MMAEQQMKLATFAQVSVHFLTMKMSHRVFQTFLQLNL